MSTDSSKHVAGDGKQRETPALFPGTALHGGQREGYLFPATHDRLISGAGTIGEMWASWVQALPLLHSSQTHGCSQAAPFDPRQRNCQPPALPHSFTQDLELAAGGTYVASNSSPTGPKSCSEVKRALGTLPRLNA